MDTEKTTTKPKAPIERWNFSEFKILQVTPCTGLLAVYAIDDEASPGKYKLEGEPIHFLAVAEKTTYWFSRRTGSNEPGKETHADSANVIVGLELANGAFEVCNEVDNFAGYCRHGDDLFQATGYLSTDKFPLSV